MFLIELQGIWAHCAVLVLVEDLQDSYPTTLQEDEACLRKNSLTGCRKKANIFSVAWIMLQNIAKDYLWSNKIGVIKHLIQIWFQYWWVWLFPGLFFRGINSWQTDVDASESHLSAKQMQFGRAKGMAFLESVGDLWDLLSISIFMSFLVIVEVRCYFSTTFWKDFWVSKTLQNAWR